MGNGVTGMRGAGLWGQEAHLSRRRRRRLRLSRRAALGAREQVLQTCHEERSGSVG